MVTFGGDSNLEKKKPIPSLAEMRKRFLRKNSSQIFSVQVENNISETLNFAEHYKMHSCNNRSLVFNFEKIASTAATEHTSSGESPTGKIYGEFTKVKRQNLYCISYTRIFMVFINMHNLIKI